MEGTIKVAIICTNRLLRESLVYELSQQTCMNVVHSVAEVREITQGRSKLSPDVIITEFSSLRRDQLEDIQQLRIVYPEAKLLVIGLNELESEFLQCIELGAFGLGCLKTPFSGHF